MMSFVDDRTDKQKQTHTCIVVGTDTFMSGWGKAEGGKSIAGWACKPRDASAVFDWVKSRSDMKSVRRVSNGWRPKTAKHVHIYVVTDDHPARVPSWAQHDFADVEV